MAVSSRSRSPSTRSSRWRLELFDGTGCSSLLLYLYVESSVAGQGCCRRALSKLTLSGHGGRPALRHICCTLVWWMYSCVVVLEWLRCKGARETDTRIVGGRNAKTKTHAHNVLHRKVRTVTSSADQSNMAPEYNGNNHSRRACHRCTLLAENARRKGLPLPLPCDLDHVAPGQPCTPCREEASGRASHSPVVPILGKRVNREVPHSISRTSISTLLVIAVTATTIVSTDRNRRSSNNSRSKMTPDTMNF